LEAQARVARGLASRFVSTATIALPTLVANLALELAPIRVNLIAAGFVDTPLSASLLGDELDKRRAELRATLPIGRVVGPADVAALAIASGRRPKSAKARIAGRGHRRCRVRCGRLATGHELKAGRFATAVRLDQIFSC